MGLIYEAFTQYLGFNNYGDEYKVMGLSSYGSPVYSKLMEEKIFKNSKDVKLDLQFFNHTNKNFNYKFSGSPKHTTIFNEKVDTFLNLKNKKDE